MIKAWLSMHNSNIPSEWIFPPSPIHVGVAISEDCNLNCPMCARRIYKEHSRSLMAEHTFINILELLPDTVESINLSAGLGEPFLHPLFPRFVKLSVKQGIRIICFTNGTIMTRDLASTMLDAGLNLLIMSVDSLDPDIYKRIRVGTELPKVLSNLQTVVHIRETFKCPVEIRISKIIFPNEKTENIIEFIQLAAQTGVDGIELRLYNFVDKSVTRSIYLGYLDLDFTTISSTSDIPIYLPKLPKLRGHLICTDIWHSMYFDVGGNLRHCCLDFTPSKSVKDKTRALTTWSKGQIAKMRFRFINGNVPERCQRCALAQSVEAPLSKVMSQMSLCTNISETV